MAGGPPKPGLGLGLGEGEGTDEEGSGIAAADDAVEVLRRIGGGGRGGCSLGRLFALTRGGGGGGGPSPLYGFQFVFFNGTLEQCWGR